MAVIHRKAYWGCILLVVAVTHRLLLPPPECDCYPDCHPNASATATPSTAPTATATRTLFLSTRLLHTSASHEPNSTMSGHPDSDFIPDSDVLESSPGRRVVTADEANELIQNSNPSSYVELPLPDDAALTARQRARLAEHHFTEALDKYGYTAVVDLAFQNSKGAEHRFHADSYFKSLELWRTSGICLLGDIPLHLLRSLLDGTLNVKVAGQDAELHGYFTGGYWTARQSGSFAPIHYVRIFGDRHGKSPSPRQLFLVLDDLAKYVSGDPQHDDTCAEIDGMSGRSRSEAADIREGLHHFFEGSVGRPPVLLTFIEAHKAYLATIADDQHDQPIPHPLQYVGFTTSVGRRAAEHDNGSTSWLTSLFDAVCRRLFQRPDGGPVFRFELYVVAFPVSRDECKLGEELLSRMCKSYFYTGLGFNIQAAGVSSVDGKLKDLSEAKAASAWQDRLMLRDASPQFGRQIAEDITNLMPKWGKMLKYRAGPEAHLQRQIAGVDAEVAKTLAAGPSEADVQAQVRAMEAQHREDEEEVDEVVRDALVKVHRLAETKLIDELDSVRAMSTSSE
jgi:hypothetical protein